MVHNDQGPSHYDSHELGIAFYMDIIQPTLEVVVRWAQLKRYSPSSTITNLTSGQHSAAVVISTLVRPPPFWEQVGGPASTLHRK
jgi:hypothetical protein